MENVWAGELHATWRNQGSPHTRILGNVFIILYFDAIWSSLKRKACNSIKYGHMQSFSTTHNLRLVLRKRYVWKRRTSSTKRFAWLQECHELYPNRTRSTVNKIHKAKKARSSWDPSSDSKSCGETCSKIVDYRISGVPLSAVEQQNTTRENKVKKLIEKFENHQLKESFFQDFSQTQKINKFSKESQEFIADMNNTEFFELSENSSQTAMSRVQYLLGNRDNLLHLRKKYEILRWDHQSSSRTTTTSPQSLAMLSRKRAVVEPHTDLLKD